MKAAAVGNTKATLKATVNPESKATDYHFEYVDQAGFEAGGFSGPTVKSTPPASLPADLSLHAVSAEIGCQAPSSPPQAGCLTPETAYHLRLVASNADNPTGTIEEGPTFTTLAPLEIAETFATEVGTDAAVLHAVVNPLGIPATGFFEYVGDATYQADLKAGGPDHGFDHAARTPDVDGGQAPIDLGAGNSEVAVSAQLSSLVPGATYHYRFSASDPFATILGEAGLLTTFPLPSDPGGGCPNQAFRVGASANLPDCRAYEMVSPVEKGNADIQVKLNGNSFPAALDQSSGAGNSLTFSSEKSFGDAVSAPYTSQYLANRQEGLGWSTHAISPSRGAKSISQNASVIFDLQYKAFAPDLSSGWLLHDTDPTLDACAAPGFLNLYRRNDSGGGYEALTTAEPTNRAAESYTPELQGLSADGTHAVFRANAKLTKNASGVIDGPGGIYQLYEHVAGKGCGSLRLVSVLPDGKASLLESNAGAVGDIVPDGRRGNAIGAVSADGSRIFWSSGGALYLRIDGKETVQVSAGPAGWEVGAADGSKAIYRVNNKALYEFDVESQTQTLIAAESRGVVAASKDASRIYFVSNEALAGAAKAGQPNLYLHQSGGATTFIATVSTEDFGISFHVPLAIVGSPTELGARTTADGSTLAFASSAGLTGYDNHDAENGRPNFEVYVYEAATGELSCVSCNPSGARPVGREVKGPQNGARMVAAQLPGWPNQLYAPRTLAADGNRLFFESFEALVPRDSNGKGDVYEWERAGSAAACEAKGAEAFVASADGCLSLVSSGQSPSDSEFVDANAEGSDVFFKTAAGLLPQDPGLVDIYDARINGGFAPEPPPVPACEGEACQGLPAPPNDPTPASAAFQGAGNVKEGAPTKPRCRKGKARRKGRCTTQKTKQAKRANHNGRAGR